jgi:hypothetical protein
MPWSVAFDETFHGAFLRLPVAVQDALLVRAGLLREIGPVLARPYADTLKGSKHANMKELRFDAAGGVWRVAFAFDARSRAVLLVAGDKLGLGRKASEKFHRDLIAIADARFDRHLRSSQDDGRM